MAGAEVPEGTARHGLVDHHDIGHVKHAALVRRLVDALFTADYLTSRGLNTVEAARHNELVAGAVDATLSTWDRLAAFSNVMPEHFKRVETPLRVELGLSVDVPVRLAAYDSLYGYLHPCLMQVHSWSCGPGLKVWWASLESRARTPIQVSKLHRVGELDSHTIRALRDGKTLPKEGTIRPLAEQLAAHGVRGDDRDATASELEFELRLVVAACEHRHLLLRVTEPSPSDENVAQFWIIRDVLRGAPDALAEDLLRNGTQSLRWGEVQPAVVGKMVERIHRMASTLSAEFAGRVATMVTDPCAGWRRMAEDFSERAAYWRRVDERPGADGPDKRWAEWFEGERDRWLALADGRPHDVRAAREELLAELQADNLCLEAVDPGLKLTPDEQEGRLREAVRVCDWSPYAHRRLGSHLRGQGRLDDATIHFRRALELNPQNEEGREALAMALVAQDNHAEVLLITEDACSTVILRTARARALVRLGDVAAARRLVVGVLDECPRHPMGLRVLAECHRQAGEERKARELESRADFFESGVRLPDNGSVG